MCEIMDKNIIKETILFVDDEENILDIAKEYFGQKGYMVITAGNGLEAIKILEEQKIDCCFTDINMPEMDGLELAEYIRLKDNTIPVIVMTGYPSVDNTIKTLKNGVVDFLIKPVNLGQMEICVRRVLRERQLFIDNLILKQEVEKKAKIEELNRELHYKVEELDILNRIMRDFTRISRTFDVFSYLTDKCIEITHADESRFYVINSIFKKPFEVSASFRSDQLQKKVTEEFIMDISEDKTPVLISENRDVKGLPSCISSFIAAPLTIREKVFGVLTASVHEGDTRFTEKSIYYLSFMTHTAAYAIENLALYENVYENLIQVLEAFVKAIEAKDPYTERHSIRVTNIALAIGKEIGCSSEELDILKVAGNLHDIGKIGIRDDILMKPGKLTDQEFEIIKMHPLIGADIVGKLGFWEREQAIIRYHHERFDGKGYPLGLRNYEIPFLSRILSVADVYDAMASDRIYRKRMEESKILEIIDKGAGTQFDPKVVKAFQKVYEQGKIKE